MRIPKLSARQEYRLKLREKIEASPFMAKLFPRLKGLKLTLGFVDAAGTNRQRELKCKLNVEHAKSALWFACPGGECSRGDFDLSRALAKAVAERRKIAGGELRCEGTRTRGDGKVLPCPTLLRYKLALTYN